MPKTYTDLTVANATAGNAILASDFASLFTNSNNYRVPPMCEVYRTSTLTGYTSNTAITWQAERYDTDGMWSSGSSVTIQTAGLYLVSLNAGISANATVSLVTAGIYIGGQLSAQNYLAVANGNDSYGSVAAIYSLTAAQTVSAAFAFIGGSNYAVIGSNTAYAREQSRLSVAWLGQVS